MRMGWWGNEPFLLRQVRGAARPIYSRPYLALASPGKDIRSGPVVSPHQTQSLHIDVYVECQYDIRPTTVDVSQYCAEQIIVLGHTRGHIVSMNHVPTLTALFSPATTRAEHLTCCGPVSMLRWSTTGPHKTVAQRAKRLAPSPTHAPRFTL
ncbi:hypothetical protein J6590_069291 [Homalodisca vitripennis]|nr:hypothetical protein J6590_069291 [Homalodisca vitripennis]